MKILFHKEFRRRYRKLRQKEKEGVDERIALFTENPFHPLLNNHALKGEYAGYRSIDITGDIRLIYEEPAHAIAHFVLLGTHSELYE